MGFHEFLKSLDPVLLLGQIRGFWDSVRVENQSVPGFRANLDCIVGRFRELTEHEACPWLARWRAAVIPPPPFPPEPARTTILA